MIKLVIILCVIIIGGVALKPPRTARRMTSFALGIMLVLAAFYFVLVR